MRGREDLQAAAGRAEVLERKLREAEEKLRGKEAELARLEAELAQARKELRRLERYAPKPTPQTGAFGRRGPLTLIELMIIVSLIGGLAAVIIPLLHR
jgi:hypothetical protein